MAAKQQAEPNETLEVIISQAADLFAQKEAVYEGLAAARTVCRSLVTLGQCNDEQAAWVAEYFPLKKRGPRNVTDAAQSAE